MGKQRLEPAAPTAATHVDEIAELLALGLVRLTVRRGGAASTPPSPVGEFTGYVQAPEHVCVATEFSEAR